MRDLEKQIEEIELKIKNLQKYWLREQENMVILTKDRQEQIKDNNLLKKRNKNIHSKTASSLKFRFIFYRSSDSRTEKSKAC